MFRCLVVLGFVSTWLSAAASGQYYGGGYYWGGGHASTAAESAARGMSDLIRSSAEANLTNAQALSAVEDARSKYIDNRNKATAAYYDRKRIRDEYKQQEAEKRRYYRANQANKLAPMEDEELDRAQGKINWPPLLADPQYDRQREVFDQIYANRAATGLVSNDDYVRANNVSKSWRRLLTDKRDEYDFDALRDSILFIRRLEKDLSL